jgi:hypothetical protein
LIVPDEWLPERLAGSDPDRRLAFQFLDLVEDLNEILVIRRSSQFTAKLQRGLKQMPSAAKRLWMMLHDSDRVVLIGDEEIITLPDDVAMGIPADDVYLVEAAASRGPSLLVTTDGPLIEIVNSKQVLQAQHLDDFLREHQR